MIHCFKSNLIEKTISEVKEICPGTLITLVNPSSAEIDEISQKTGIERWFFDSALDEEEQSRIEYEDDTTLILIDIPKEIEEDGISRIFTTALAIIANDDYFITVCMHETSILDNIFKNRFQVETSDYRKVFYHILINNFTRFIYYLKKIDKNSSDVLKDVDKDIKNKEILEILEYQKTLVFFSTSLSGNIAVIQKLIANTTYKTTIEEKELLDSILIEAKQAMEMCTVYREILKNTMDAFESIANNNMNNIMRVLTAVTIILSMPMVVAGYWGMNTGVPWETEDYGFWLAIFLSVIFSIMIFYYLKKRKMM